MENTPVNEAPARETLGFQAEVKQLLHLMVHSLYGNSGGLSPPPLRRSREAGKEARMYVCVLHSYPDSMPALREAEVFFCPAYFG